MSAFKVINAPIPIALGIGILPATYYTIVGRPRYVDTGGTIRHLDLVSSLEDSFREEDYLTKATLTYPTCRFGIATVGADKSIFVTPAVGINPIYIDYIRMADVPFLDYYLNDATLNYTWMDANSVVTVPSGSTARNGSIGTVDVLSQTKDWEWDQEDLPLIINLFLKFMGIQLPSSELFEGGTLLETKQDEG
jgi:hypothetical protein